MTSYNKLIEYLDKCNSNTFSPFIIIEGGNASVGNIRANKTDIKMFGREYLKNTLLSIFKKLDDLYFKSYKERLFVNFNNFEEFVTGSSKFIFDKSVSDEDFIKYKPIVGDIDIAIDGKKIKNLLDLLNSNENTLILDNVVFIGATKDEIKSEEAQINTIFKITKDKLTTNIQIDFEGSEYKDNKPSEFSKFSHSSNWEDIKDGFKGVCHKFLLRALAKSISPIGNYIIVTPKSTFDNYKISTSNKNSKSLLSFSVSKGLRTKYIPVKNTSGEILKINGKTAYKEDLDTSIEKYDRNINSIFSKLFKVKPKKNDIELFKSFKGCIELINKYHSKEIEDSIIRNLLDGVMIQGLERDNPKSDMKIKLPLLGALIVKFNSNRGKLCELNDSFRELARMTYEEPVSYSKINYVDFTYNGKEYIVEFDKFIQKYLNDYYMNYGD